jgi:hypothetical protein
METIGVVLVILGIGIVAAIVNTVFAGFFDPSLGYFLILIAVSGAVFFVGGIMVLFLIAALIAIGAAVMSIFQ